MQLQNNLLILYNISMKLPSDFQEIDIQESSTYMTNYHHDAELSVPQVCPIARFEQ